MAVAVRRAALAYKLSEVYLGSDCRPCAEAVRTKIAELGPAPFTVRVAPEVAPASRATDLQLFTGAAVFIGNCASSFSGFAARARELDSTRPGSGTSTVTLWFGAGDNDTGAGHVGGGGGGGGFEVVWDGNEFGGAGDSETTDPQTLWSDVLLQDAPDGSPWAGGIAGELAEVTTVEGTVTVTELWTVETFSLPDLEMVRFGLKIQHSGFRAAAFPELKTVGGDVLFASLPDLVEIALPSLETAGSLTIRRLPLLAVSPGLPVLRSVTRELVVADNIELTELKVPKLQEVNRSITLINNGVIVSMATPRLKTIGTFLEVYRNHRLKSINAPMLAAVGGAIYVAYTPALEHFAPLQPGGGGTEREGGGLKIIPVPGVFLPYELEFKNMASSPLAPCRSAWFARWPGKKRCS